MKKVIAVIFLTMMIMATFSGPAFAHERCVTLNELSSQTNGHTDGVVEQVIANGQAEGDPASDGIRNARDESPALESCPSD